MVSSASGALSLARRTPAGHVFAFAPVSTDRAPAPEPSPDVLLATAEELAIDVLDQARVSLMAQLPFMDVALWRLPLEPAHLPRPLATDGFRLLFDAPLLLTAYRAAPSEVLRDYLHLVLHCVFRQPFDSRHPQRSVWDLSCDIVVEATALDLCGLGFPSDCDIERRRALEKIAIACPELTAGKLYRLLVPLMGEARSAGDAGAAGAPASAFADSPLTRSFVKTLPALFERDAHDRWPRADERSARTRRLGPEAQLMPSDGTERSAGEAEERSDDLDDQEPTPGVDMPGAPAPASSTTAVEAEVEHPDSFVDLAALQEAEATFADMDDVVLGEFDDISWQDISGQIEMDLAAFTGKIGLDAGTFLVNLQVANRKRYDYRDFLKRFAALSEEMKVSTDEFDYIYYTYGLSRYRNMPLVEPLEYQETNRIRDFVIAIDTSASCTGGLVRSFVEKTYDVLRNSEGFGHQVNIHVIQCDCDIRSDKKITTIRDLGGVFYEFSTCGHGGTDFRPVFAHVQKLIDERELVNLKGLLYFTDGLGKYPLDPPGYEVAFVFVDDTPRHRRVPPWAMKVIMDEEDILEL